LRKSASACFGSGMGGVQKSIFVSSAEERGY